MSRFVSQPQSVSIHTTFVYREGRGGARSQREGRKSKRARGGERESNEEEREGAIKSKALSQQGSRRFAVACSA